MPSRPLLQIIFLAPFTLAACGGDRLALPDTYEAPKDGGTYEGNYGSGSYGGGTYGIDLPPGYGLVPASAAGGTAPVATVQPASYAPSGGIDASTLGPSDLSLYPGETPAMRAKINRWADFYDVPRSLVHKVVQRESDYRADARNGPYYGLMQILPDTARSMGFRGADADLLDADTNLKYAVKYLRGAWLVSDGDEAEAVQWYARGYYYEARNRCMLRATGLRDTEVRQYCG